MDDRIIMTDRTGSIDASTVLVATDAWRSTFPGAVVGALIMRDVRNPEASAALEAGKRRLEDLLRAAGASGDGGAGADRVLRAYVDYYRARGKSYHVKAQRESVALKGKPIPCRAALVEAMFMAELETLILTAGHDLDAVTPPVRVDVTADDDRYVQLNGADAVLARGDMMIADATGILSSVLRGPDQRTAITRQTRHVLFTAYAPAPVGEDAVRGHLETIHANVGLVAPAAQTEALVTLVAA
jgi:DNA/RNA-binding domain of Phe-tRNA-synthetase-like protein